MSPGFRISVARGLVTAGKAVIPHSASSMLGCPMRLLGHNHYPEPVGGMPDSNRHCGKRKRTSYMQQSMLPYAYVLALPTAIPMANIIQSSV